MKAYRFLVKESFGESSWELYKCYGNDAKGLYVGTITDYETLKLLISAPATKQLLENVKQVYPKLTLSARDYSQRTLRDFASAFVGYLRKL